MSLRNDRLDEDIRRAKTDQIRYQFRTFLSYAFLMAFIVSKGMDSDHTVVKLVFFGFIITCLFFLYRNLTRWLACSSRLTKLTEEKYQDD